MPSAVDYGVESVLDVVTGLFGLSGSARGQEYDVLCPDPRHNESKPSCSINLDTGYWHCFSCGVGGDLVALGHLVLGRPAEDVAGLLVPSTAEAKAEALKRKLLKMQYRRPMRKKTVELPEYPALGSHPELRRRMFTESTIAHWGLGWVAEQELVGNKGTYTIANSIAIPIKDADGVNQAWCYRSTASSPKWQPRYLYTPGVEISELWFGLEHHANMRQVTIVEGALDAMWMTQCGFPALALLGSQMGDRKIMWLQVYRMITQFPDYDNAGAKWQARMADMLGARIPMRLAQYRPWMMKKTPEPDGSYRRAKDPEELSPVDVELAHASAVPVITQSLISSRKVSDRF